ncbi:AAA family ATPase [Photobacterium sp. GB-72]|uniref:AAA family ATPase n=1 Tax=Photobacterium sp. GB-72 TaxID=2022105 RepID=UPI0013048B11|nr:AAA family ATPase [Photobacterium sp. GB-72]
MHFGFIHNYSTKKLRWHMLKRIKLIQGVGNYTQTRASGIELTDVTVVYGENRYGKSTLCDVIHSLAEDSPEFILDRKTIPNDPTKLPKVEFLFSTAAGNVTSKFENEQWQVKAPECSKLYVFDHSFIHRNVITGQKQERPNSENMTSFILGESNTALYTALADMNRQLRDERRNLNNIESQLNTHVDGNVAQYVASALPPQTKEQLEANLGALETTKQQLFTTIQNIDSIKRRNVLTAVGVQVNYTPVIESINAVLASSLQNVHQGSLDVLQNHMDSHVNNASTFKGWASQGVIQIKDDCPFCGQELTDTARGLIAVYQQAFNAEFDRFNSQTRTTLNGLRQPFAALNTREQLSQQHLANRQIFEMYVEPQVTGNPALAPLTATLEQKHEDILTSFDSVMAQSQEATEFWLPRLEHKFATPYEQAEAVGFDQLLIASTAYNQAIYEYREITEQINAVFNGYKNSLDVAQLNTQLMDITRQQTQANASLKRVNLEPLCDSFRRKKAQVADLETGYQTQKRHLDQSQSVYLDTYFDQINRLFRQLGSSNFEIIKTPNNRGQQVIYDLKVRFKGVDIPADKINTVFSESDRRALALCIFLAKIMSLDPEEKAKAILVMDDPVTSFDNERIALILNKLDELQRNVKQLVITTHYKGMASKAVKKFRRCAKSVKLVHGVDTCSIEEVDLDDMMATEHDIAFDRIKAFVNRETNVDILTNLRPFFEEEIRYRYKKQLGELGHAKADLSVCTAALRDHGIMTTELEARLSAIRDTLNTPMHEIGGDALENTRTLAGDILDVVYNGLNAS